MQASREPTRVLAHPGDHVVAGAVRVALLGLRRSALHPEPDVDLAASVGGMTRRVTILSRKGVEIHGPGGESVAVARVDAKRGAASLIGPGAALHEGAGQGDAPQRPAELSTLALKVTPGWTIEWQGAPLLTIAGSGSLHGGRHIGLKLRLGPLELLVPLDARVCVDGAFFLDVNRVGRSQARIGLASTGERDFRAHRPDRAA